MFQHDWKSNNSQSSENNESKHKSTKSNSNKPFCSYCKKRGHTQDKCFKLKNKRSNEESADVALVVFDSLEDNLLNVPNNFVLSQMSDSPNSMSPDIALTNVSKGSYEKLTPSTWILDSGASSHYKINTSGMTNLKEFCKPVTIGNGMKLYTSYIGDYPCMCIAQDSTCEDFIMTDVYVIPDFHFNLFSMNCALSKGATLSNDKTTVYIIKDTLQITFD